MADQRGGGILWTDETWGPVTGCNKVSQGCKNCYAERQFKRFSGNTGIYAGRQFTDVRCHEDRLDQPLRWKRPRKIFVNSMSDLFHEDVPDEFIDKVFAVMALARQHIFQLLTKRPERMREYLTRSPAGIEACRRRIATIMDGMGNSKLADEVHVGDGWTAPGGTRWPLPNVWLGVSVEDQATADERVPLLLQTPAAVRWVSAEPLLGPVDFTRLAWNRLLDRNSLKEGDGVPHLDWIVVGGESGPKARPMHPAWVRSIRDQCAVSRVPFTFKQWGEYQPISRTDGYHELPFGDYDVTSGFGFKKVGKKRAGRLLDGREYNEFPKVK